MGVPEIRGALGTLLAGVAGMKSASGYPPETIGPAVPAAFVGAGVRTVVQAFAPSELHEHTLIVNVLVQRAAGNTKNAIIAAETMAPAILARIRPNQNLGLANVYQVRVTEFRTDLVAYGGDNADYAAVILELAVQERLASSFGVT